MQSIGATGAFPVSWHAATAVLAGTIAAVGGRDSSQNHDIDSFLADIGL